jgi:hypothetical protein
MAIIPHAERQELPALADIPISDLAQHCQDPSMLTTIISLAFNQGYKLGQEQAHRYYNMMFKGQSETIINN